ncbi:hypothetical protein NGRA_2761 [Nosema granulosis]|uniref:PH domain-containing protein n=1 Tax=Nosema granulosis TaxID=83296 RepID=A0A9P6GZ88_9MICR|nr:hypothetical protein NGRA_2761 [Nosema granulosis]
MPMKENEQEEVYLSPESVRSRIKSINEEIQSRHQGDSVHERTAKRYEESLKESKVEDYISPTLSIGSLSIDSRLSRNSPSNGTSSTKPTIGTRTSIGTTTTIGTSIPTSIPTKPTIGTTTTIGTQEGRVREIVKDFSLKNSTTKNPFTTTTKNPFTTATTTKNPFTTATATKNPFFIKNTKKNTTSATKFVDDLSILSSNSTTPTFSKISLTPINVLYSPKDHPKLTPSPTPSPIPKRVFNKTLGIVSSLYAPGEELSQKLSFSILNTVYSFDKDLEDTVYYFRVESNTTWIIRKTLSQLKKFLKKPLEHSYNPFDKKIRDSTILTILNNTTTTNTQTGDLQYFILTDISKNSQREKRSTFLLMDDLQPYNFRLVGQALVCYDQTNRVSKIFLLKGCSVEPQDEYCFRISSPSLESSVLLYASCSTERDSWVEDIQDFIKCIETPIN